MADPYEIPNQADISGVRDLRVVPAARQLLDRAHVRPEARPEHLPGRAGRTRRCRRWPTSSPSTPPTRTSRSSTARPSSRPPSSSTRAPAAPTPCGTWRTARRTSALTRGGLDAVFNGPDGIGRNRRRLRRDPVPAEPRRGRPGQGRLPEHRRARRLRLSSRRRRTVREFNPAPFGVTFSGPRVQRADA